MILITVMWFVVVAKYLSIYHGNWINLLNEDKTISVLKRTVIIFPACLTAFEYGALTDMKRLTAFRIFSGSKLEHGNDNVEVLTTYVFLAFLCTCILLQTRLEIDQVTFNENGCLSSLVKLFANKSCSDDNDNNPGGQTKFRILFAAGSGFAMFVIYNVAFNLDNVRNSILMYHIILFTLCPCIFVINHDSMKALARNQFRFYFSVDRMITLQV